MLQQPPNLPRVTQAAICRPALDDRIRAVRPGGLCLVAAAPGFGATTAVVQALGADRESVVWITAPGSDAGRGLRESAAEAGPRVDWVVADHAARVGPPDWHHLEELRASLAPHTRLVVICHQEPPAGWRIAASEPGCAYLATGDLRCTTDEAVQILHRWQPDLDIDVVSSVVDAAQGWAAALSAAGAQARQGPLPPGWLDGPGALLLLRDWLERLPAEQRDMLEQSVVLDRLSVASVAAVCASAGAGRALLELNGEFGYLSEVAAPDGRHWERHRLLTSALLQMPQSAAGPRHVRAAAWYTERGDLERTMQHLVAAGRTQDAARHLRANESDLFRQGRADLVKTWYGEVARGQGPDAAQLLRIGWGQAMTGEVRAAEASLAQLDAHTLRTCGPDHRQDAESAGDIELLRAYLAAFRADPNGMVAAGRDADHLLLQRGVTDAQQLAPLVVAQGLLWSGHVAEADALLRDLRLRPFPHDVLREATLAGLRAQSEVGAGRILEAAAICRSTRDWLSGRNIDPLRNRQYGLVTAEAQVAVDSGDLESGAALAAEVYGAADAQNAVGESVFARLVASRACAAGGDLGAAMRMVVDARARVVQLTPGSSMLVALDLEQARLHLAAGDRLRAERTIRSLPSSSERTLLWAMLQAPSQAAVVRRNLELLASDNPRVEAAKHLLLARLHQRSPHPSRRLAEGHLAKAADVAARNGQALLLVGAEDALVRMAEDLALREQDDALRWLLDRRRGCIGASPVPAVGLGPAAPLSRGDLQLIPLLPTRASNAEIAELLGVSVNTIKTRLRRLYIRLEATNRDEAAQRAEQRGLLPPRTRI